jgi:hypothetical protein
MLRNVINTTYVSSDSVVLCSKQMAFIQTLLIKCCQWQELINIFVYRFFLNIYPKFIIKLFYTYKTPFVFLKNVGSSLNILTYVHTLLSRFATTLEIDFINFLNDLTKNLVKTQYDHPAKLSCYKWSLPGYINEYVYGYIYKFVSQREGKKKS